MLEKSTPVNGSATRLLARGNFSLSGHGLLLAIAVLAATTLGLAGWLAAKGYWPILGVAALQAVVVSWILVRAWKGCWVEERIEVGEDSIAVERVRYKASERFEMSTRWARVHLARSSHDWYPPRLWLRSRRRQVELGTFLVGEERERLAQQLAEAIRPHSAWQSSILQVDGAQT